MPRERTAIMPRLVGRADAAAYCGLSLPSFDRYVAAHVPSVPGFGARALWDLRAIDEWLDRKSGLSAELTPLDEWLEKLRAGNHADRAHPRRQ